MSFLEYILSYRPYQIHLDKISKGDYYIDHTKLTKLNIRTIMQSFKWQQTKYFYAKHKINLYFGLWSYYPYRIEFFISLSFSRIYFVAIKYSLSVVLRSGFMNIILLYISEVKKILFPRRNCIISFPSRRVLHL